MGRLALRARLASRHKLPHVGLQGGPPESSTDELAGSRNPGMTRELAGVAPYENSTTDPLGNE